MNKKILACLLLLAAGHSAAVEIGDRWEDVAAELGPPQSEALVKGRRQLFYLGGIIELEGDTVTYVDPGFQDRAAQRKEAAAFEAAQRAKGLVPYEGRWVRPSERQALEERKAVLAREEALRLGEAVNAPGHAQVRDIRQGGKAIDLASVLAPGKITVVDFYADWCGPCRKLAPYLVDYASRHSDVQVVKIDIVNWESDVVRQHNIRSVPNLRVFDRAGRPVGSPTSDLNQVIEYCATARR